MAPRYSNRRENSIYAIKAGTILELKECKLKHNPEIGRRAEHKVQIWIQSLGVIRERQRPQERKARVLFLFVPIESEYKNRYLIWEQRMQVVSLIRRHLKGGYKVLATGLPFYRRKKYYQKPYEIMGILKYKRYVSVQPQL